MCLAVPGQIETITGDNPLTRTGRVRFGGMVKKINLAYVPEAQVGDFVLVHVGFAITRLEPEAAQQVFTYLDEIADLSESDEP
jgi:hydrogenase expression/formation protein HypC